MTDERASAIVVVGAVMAWANAVRAIPVAELSELAAEPDAEPWLVGLSIFRKAIEISSPPAPVELPTQQLCPNCVSAPIARDGLCSTCSGLRHLTRAFKAKAPGSSTTARTSPNGYDRRGLELAITHTTTTTEAANG
jgi:hypothetical protein